MSNELIRMNVESGAILYRVPGVRSGDPLAASPDDRLLAAARSEQAKNKDGIGIWEATTGKEVTTVAAGAVSHLALTSDNRHLVAADRGFLRVWDLATGKEKQHWPLPEANTCIGTDPVVTRLLLSLDGRRAFTALNDGTALVWDLRPALRRPPSDAQPSEKEQAAWWKDLAENDARLAYAAIWRLSDTPQTTIPFLRRRLKPATDADLLTIRRLIADLDSDDFVTREKASEQLAKLGPAAESVMRHALEQKPTVEARLRMQHLLEQFDRQPPSADVLRLLRALQVLENTGAEGCKLLRELANGTDAAWLTREAKAALARRNRSAP